MATKRPRGFSSTVTTPTPSRWRLFLFSSVFATSLQDFDIISPYLYKVRAEHRLKTLNTGSDIMLRVKNHVALIHAKPRLT